MRTFSRPQWGWYMPSSVLQGQTEGEGCGSKVGRGAGGRGGAPVSGILEVRVVLEGGIAENHRGLGTAADWEGVSNDRPLWTGSHMYVSGRPTWRVSRALSPSCPSGTPPALPLPGAPLPEPGPSPSHAAAPRGGTSLGGRGAKQASGDGVTRSEEEEAAWGAGVRPGNAKTHLQPTTGGRRTLVGVGFPDAFSGLEGMEGVGEVHVWVRLVHQPVQHVHSFQDSHFLVGEGPKLGVLGQEGEVSTATRLVGSGRGPLHPSTWPGEEGLAGEEAAKYLLPDEVHGLLSVHELIRGKDTVQERALATTGAHVSEARTPGSFRVFIGPGQSVRAGALTWVSSRAPHSGRPPRPPARLVTSSAPQGSTCQ